MKSFGEIAWNWPKVDSKKKLIQSRVIAKDGITSKIFREFAVQTPLSNHLLGFLARELTIKGYRVEEKPFREKMLPKLALELEKDDRDERIDKAFWTIYDRSCQIYLNNRQNNLNKCLENESPLIVLKTTKDFFQQISIHMTKYNFTQSDLLEFSKFWHFEELENFEADVFSSENKTLEAMSQLVQRLSESDIVPLKTELQELKKEQFSLEEKIGNIPNLTQINFLIEQAASQAKEVKTYVDKRVTSIPSDFEKRLASFSISIDEIKKQIAKSAQNKEIQSAFEELRNKIEAIEKKLENVTIIGESLEQSQLKVVDRVVTNEVAKVNETDFIKMAASEFKKDKNLGWLDDSLVTLFHCIFASTGSICLKDSIIFEAWIRMQPDLKSSVIYPEADWVNSDEFAASIKENENCDLVIVENFEIGIYEAYALPTLLKTLSVSKPRIVFKSGEYTEMLPSHQLLKTIPVLSLQQIDRSRNKKHPLKDNILQNSSSVVSGSWDSKRNLKEVLEFIPTLLNYSKSVGVEIPPILLNGAWNLANHLNYYFDEKAAIAVAVEVVILPYLLEMFGRDLCGSFVSAANTFLDDKLGIA